MASSILDSPTCSSLASKCTILRAELKEWEKAFAVTHEGRKPGRNDIKKVSEIASKYKDYTRVRDILAGKIPPEATLSPQINQTPARKRKRTIEGDSQATRLVHSTPVRNHHCDHSIPSQLDPYDSPSTLKKLFSPRSSTRASRFRTAIGPTPQRDGKVLGLFDLLPSSAGSRADGTENMQADSTKDHVTEIGFADTPSKRRGIAICNAGPDESLDISTPSRLRHSRTPVSTGKRLLLSHFFATPTARRFASIVEEQNVEISEILDTSFIPGDETASQPENSLGGPNTPAFLRRSSSQVHGQQQGTSGSTTSPVAVRRPPRLSQGRSLSELVQGLRNLEDERLEEDLDVLREIEAEQQAQLEMVPGEEASYAAETERRLEGMAKEPQAAPSAGVWKKRGQKRTTKRVIMRPIWTKSKPRLDALACDEDGSKLLDGCVNPQEKEDPSENGRATPETAFECANDEALRDTTSKDNVNHIHSNGLDSKSRLNVERKAGKRKVKADAHANYRTLKIRSKTSKGGKGRFSRKSR